MSEFYYNYWSEGNRESNKFKYLVVVSDFPVKMLRTYQENVQDHQDESEPELLQLIRSCLKAAERARVI